MISIAVRIMIFTSTVDCMSMESLVMRLTDSCTKSDFKPLLTALELQVFATVFFQDILQLEARDCYSFIAVYNHRCTSRR